jgi:hypothetical protein
MRQTTPDVVQAARDLVDDAETARNEDWRQMLVELAREKLRQAQDPAHEGGRFGADVRLYIDETTARAEALAPSAEAKDRK